MINGRIGFAPLLTKIVSVTLFGKIIPVGFWGVWLTTGLTWTITAIVCIIRYNSGVWKKKRLAFVK